MPKAICSAEYVGSSPRTRGTLLDALDGRRGVRFIPAYTGNSSTEMSGCTPPSVHPRVHGELDAVCPMLSMFVGSSPRTRGTPRADGHRGLPDRFIPAYTGNSRPGSGSGRPTAVHPRVHGELILCEDGALKNVGSSPRTRGTRVAGVQGRPDVRFIPAYTGNSPQTLQLWLRLPVHPRVHGELGMAPAMVDQIDGSSPRTRGTQISFNPKRRINRFIPAYTGNSGACGRSRGRDTVHPRVHGELRSAIFSGLYHFGSSPRTRGTHDTDLPAPRGRRFIPAYTGNSDRNRRMLTL